MGVRSFRYQVFMLPLVRWIRGFLQNCFSSLVCWVFHTIDPYKHSASPNLCSLFLNLNHACVRINHAINTEVPISI